MREPSTSVINWNMNTTCNYRCSYCTQRFVQDRGRWAGDVPRFLEAFGRLPGTWEIKLSGGEPFRHPRFIEVASGIKALGYSVSVVTNFSANEARLLEFLEAAEGHIGVFSASLHLEYVKDETDLASFIERGVLVNDALRGSGSFCVTCVATRDNLPRLRPLRERFAAAGLRFKIQPEKQNRDVIDYSEGETEQLLQLGGHNDTGRVAANFYGRLCWAGARYFIVDDTGRAYRCYPARRYKREYLGNLLRDDFELATGPVPCGYSYCNCTVPIERGMMERR